MEASPRAKVSAVSDPHADLVASSASVRFETTGSTAYEMMRLETFSDPLDLMFQANGSQIGDCFQPWPGPHGLGRIPQKSADLKLASPRRAFFFVLLTRPCLLPGYTHLRCPGRLPYPNPGLRRTTADTPLRPWWV